MGRKKLNPQMFVNIITRLPLSMHRQIATLAAELGRNRAEMYESAIWFALSHDKQFKSYASKLPRKGDNHHV